MRLISLTKSELFLQGVYYLAVNEIIYGKYYADDVINLRVGITICVGQKRLAMDADHSIVQFDNLYKSLRRVIRGVRWKDGVALYAADGLKNTYKLRQSIINNEYEILPYNVFKVTDPKERIVMATALRDRQFQDSLCNNYFYDEITKCLIRDNFACQRGRGVDDALERLEIQLHKYYRKHGSKGFCLKCDVHHYFAETSHKIAKAAVDKRIDDKEVVAETDRIVDSFGDRKGIGLGSPVSQLIELAVLSDLDHFIKERLRIKYYVRYMDDFILIHEDKEYLQYCLKEIRNFLNNIGLELNKKTVIFSLSQGITFLHWRFYLEDSGRVVKLVGKKTISKERRKLRRMKPKVDAGELGLDKPIESFMSWAAGVKRRLSRKNTLRRKKGKRAFKGYNAKYVEKMRDYFIRLYGVDPYLYMMRWQPNCKTLYVRHTNCDKATLPQIGR